MITAVNDGDDGADVVAGEHSFLEYSWLKVQSNCWFVLSLWIFAQLYIFLIVSSTLIPRVVASVSPTGVGNWNQSA